MISNYHDPEIVTEVKRKEKNGIVCPVRDWLI
jgi:hypothetical protein